jgi:nicotinate-nucleotide pyrophosphorylase (carboxylating)
MPLHFPNESLESARARNIRDALAEDIGEADLTAELLDAHQRSEASLLVREEAVLCGRDWFEGCLKALDPQAQCDWRYKEGDLLKARTTVCSISANTRALLTAERTGINFLQTLSATATQTRAHVKAIEGVSPSAKGCLILDTRKTIPGLRQAQKYAVRVGGGSNQRLALWHGILIKENHIAAAGGIRQALERAASVAAGRSIQIEVENLEELQEALSAGAKQILLDNFSLEDLSAAALQTKGQAELEASGGIGLDQLRRVAATGVDRISIGRLTKDIRAIDFSLRLA